MAGKKKLNNTLCWTCGKALTGGCSWAKAWEPVEGWVAVAHKLTGYYDDMRDSYCVIECPLYEDDRPTEKPEYNIEDGGSYWCKRCKSALKYGVEVCPHCESAHLDWSNVPYVKPGAYTYKKLYRAAKYVKRPDAQTVVLKGKVIQDRIKELGYKSMTSFGLERGISRNTVQKAIDDSCKLSTAKRIAKALELSLEDIYEGKFYPGREKEAL